MIVIPGSPSLARSRGRITFIQHFPPFLYRNLETVSPLTEICVKHIVGNFRGKQTYEGRTVVGILVLIAHSHCIQCRNPSERARYCYIPLAVNLSQFTGSITLLHAENPLLDELKPKHRSLVLAGLATDLPLK